MMKNNMSVLIMARPGPRRDSLRAFLRMIPRLETIDQVDDVPSALKMIDDHRPALMLLDSNLPGDGVWTVVELIKTQWPQIRCLVLVEVIRQQQMAEVASADGVLVRGFSIAEFVTTVERLLAEHEATYLIDEGSQIGSKMTL